MEKSGKNLNTVDLENIEKRHELLKKGIKELPRPLFFNYTLQYWILCEGCGVEGCLAKYEF